MPSREPSQSGEDNGHQSSVATKMTDGQAERTSPAKVQATQFSTSGNVFRGIVQESERSASDVERGLLRDHGRRAPVATAFIEKDSKPILNECKGALTAQTKWGLDKAAATYGWLIVFMQTFMLFAGVAFFGYAIYLMATNNLKLELEFSLG